MSTLAQTSRKRQNVLGYPVDIVDSVWALELIESAWREGKSLHVVTLNAEMVMASQKDSELDRIVRRAHLIIPDGAGVVFALKFKGEKAGRLPGIELAHSALHRAAISGRRVALIGGRPEVVARLKLALLQAHPGLDLVFVSHGYFSKEQEPEIVSALQMAKPDLVLVALGVPKQEYFIDEWQAKYFPKAVAIGVGGSFDVWAGTVKRAPVWMQKVNLEWFYRLYKEPWRAQRMGSTLPKFALAVLWEAFLEKLGLKKSAGSEKNPPEAGS